MKLFLALLLATATLFAAENPPPTPEMVTGYDAIMAIAARMHFDQPNTLAQGPEDMFYIAPTQEMINALLAFYEARKEQIPYLPEVFDCDDKATEFKYLAAVWSVRQWHGEAPGVLVGKAYVRIDGDYSLLAPSSAGHWVKAAHVLNFVIREDGEIFFIEPQTGCIAEVSSFIYEGSIEIIRLEY